MSITENLQKEFDDIVEEKEELQGVFEREISAAESDNDTRQKVAKRFVKYYFRILIIIIVGIPIYNFVAVKYLQGSAAESIIIPYKDVILTYSAVVGPTLGLVIAYYFKSGKD